MELDPIPHESNPLAALTQDFAAAYIRAVRWDPRLRRALRVLGDLGAPVPPGWITLHDDGTAAFGDLPAAVFDRLLCLLEDLAEQRPVGVTVVRGGSTLFGPGAPEGPAAPAAPSTVHPVIPRT